MPVLDKSIELCEAYARAHPGEKESYVALTAAYNNAAALATYSRLSSSQQHDYWRQARDLLAQGVAAIRKVDESVAMIGANKELLDEGVASLAQAEDAIARFGGS